MGDLVSRQLPSRDFPYDTGYLATMSTKRQLLIPQDKYHKIGKQQQYCQHIDTVNNTEY